MIHLSIMRNLFLCATRKRDCWKIVTLVLLLVQSLDDQGPSHLPGDLDQLPHPVLECPVCSHYQVSDKYSHVRTSSVLTTINLAPQTEINFWLSQSAKHCWNPCSGPLPVYQDLIMRYDWPVKRAIINLPIRSKQNTTLPAIHWIRWGTQNKDIGTAFIMWLTKVISNAGQTWSHTFCDKSQMKKTVIFIGKFKLNPVGMAQAWLFLR